MKKYLFGIFGIVFLFTAFIFYFTIGGKYASYMDSEMYLEKIPDFLKDHFPNDIDYYGSAQTSISYSNHEIDEIHSFKLRTSNLNENLIQKEIQKLNKGSVAVYEASDPNLLIVRNNKRNIEENFSIYLIPDLNPDSKKLGSEKNKSGLNDDFKIYIIESKLDNQLDEEIKSFKNLDLKKGYSKGVAVNEKEKTIIYWFSVW